MICAMTTIYLSSTYEDLKDYRSAVFEALRKAGYQVLAMEDYVATDRRPVEKCLADVAGADIYVGLFAFRYGYVPPVEHGNPDGLSITELEFRHAEKLRKPCLAFAVSEDAPWPPKFIDGLKGERINRLREYLLTEKTASFFSSPHQLASLVQAAVTKQLEEVKKPHAPSTKEPEPSRKITWDINRDGSPYPGLMHFTRKYAPVFFGREVEVREILDRIRLPESRFIIISGDSGVGKSSVVDAGVLPRLEEGGLPGNQSCECVRMLPSQGNHPFGSLMTALGSFATRAGLRPDAIVEELKHSPGSLTQQIRKVMSGGTDRETLVLFLDQMEELFTAQDIEESKKFLTALYQAAHEKALWVLATIRSDHLHFCHGHSEMLRVIRSQGYYPLGRIESFMMSDMITKPALCAGLKVSDNLARRVVADTGSESANLPLLAFVLEQLFQNRSDHELSESFYKTLGGVGGAIAKHAGDIEGKVRRDLGPKSAALLLQLFQSLVIVNAEGLPTRRRPLIKEFRSDLRDLANVLIRERLLHTEGQGEASTVSISHEKLFEAWPALRDYVATNKKALMDQTLLDSRARKWEEMEKPWFSGLASGREYRDFRRADMTATPLTKEYLSASLRARRIRSGVIGLMVLLVGTGTWLWMAGIPIRYAGSIVLGRLNIIPVLEPPMVVIPGKRFAIGGYEVTFEEYDGYAKLTGERLPLDQGWGRGKHPVINVSWEDAVKYANWLSWITGKNFRLPKDEEWLYAATSGGKGETWAGTSDENELNEYAWYGRKVADGTKPVGLKKPNGLKLYDMSGNVSEWVQDCEVTVAEKKCGRRGIRGGSTFSPPEFLRSSYPYAYNADTGHNFIGFRLAQDLE